jgi:hypothetical protein
MLVEASRERSENQKKLLGLGGLYTFLS